MRTFAKVVAALAAVSYLAFGIWAFAAPESFAENIASFPPYNRHLVHDLGVFGTALGGAAAAGLLFSDVLTATLAAVATGSLMHGISHIVDRGLGGQPSDPWTVSLFGVITLLAFLAAVTTRGTRSEHASRESGEGLPAQLSGGTQRQLGERDE
ncbi:MAG TPA: hypothetical protein VJT72_13800 [Pseudonocardiaceae bacterium]|nr:hypothetical protein [Pseudonocardiaceae bacterium]